MEITPCILSDLHRLKLDINNLGNKRQLKIRETEQLTTERNIDQEQNKDFMDYNENKHITYSNSEGSSKGKFISLNTFTKI